MTDAPSAPADAATPLDDAAPYLHGLVTHLTAVGALDDPTWRRTFARVPRHHHLPHFYTLTPNGWQTVSPQTSGRASWLRLAYRDQTWVVRLTGPHATPGQPASSSIQPSLAAHMLTALDITDTTHILEIGTGTGYLTALLCQRLTSHQVTSIDIDPDLIQQATTHLTNLGHHPTLAVTDGHTGHHPRAPYNRILATATVRTIPPAWLAQTSPEGKILTPLRGGLALLDVHDEQHATGRYLALPTQILPLRHTTPPSPTATNPPSPDTTTTPNNHRPLHPAALHDPHFRLFLDLAFPDIRIDDSSHLPTLTASHPDGSTIHLSQPAPHQRESPFPWNEIHAAHDLWTQIGQPTPERFGLTISNHQQTVWLDTPHSDQRWNLGSRSSQGVPAYGAW